MSTGGALVSVADQQALVLEKVRAKSQSIVELGISLTRGGFDWRADETPDKQSDRFMKAMMAKLQE